MNDKEKDSLKISLKESHELDLPEFYKALTTAITTKNMQSLYGLSKVFTRYCFKKQEN